ncbi:MAG: right-handed parallel beta-helix repeat-containing protein, partial [Desulfobacterales bacterium]|nr:right-handed parallel beta-helix repeat-containing protein [Desulfobacterales bacterium]
MNPTTITTNTYTGYPVRAVSILVACTFCIGSFLLFCGVAGAVTYDASSGINDITSTNCSYWSTILSNNDSTVQYTNINVKDGAVLNLVNATIRMRGYDINVNFNGTMNVTDGSTITRYSNYYDFKYFDGSFGYVSNSTIEYSYKLQIDTSNNLKIANSIIRNNYNEGISLTSNSGNVTLTNNVITNNRYEGIKIDSSGNVNLTNNTITNNVNEGIEIVSSENNILLDNVITDNGPIGINIVSSGNNLLRDNNLNGTLRGLYVEGNYSNDIDTSNRVNGDLVYYRYNIDGVSIVGDNVGHVTLYNCSNVSVKDNTFVTDGDGIRLVNSTINVTIDKNLLLSSNYCGIALSSSQADITNNIVTNSDTTAISLYTSHNSNITNNIVSGGIDALGIILSYSNNNVLTNNTVTGTGDTVDGILVSNSNSNSLIENILIYSGSYNGIKLSSSDSNNLINNSMKNKGQSGLYLDSGSNYNTIRDNDITNNDWGGITIDAGSHNNISNNEILSNDGGAIYDP